MVVSCMYTACVSVDLHVRLHANTRCSPVPVQGGVQQQQQGDPCSSGQDRTHPKTELTEVTVLDDGQDGGTAQEHGHLQERLVSKVFTKQHSAAAEGVSCAGEVINYDVN